MLILKITALALTGGVLAQILKKDQPVYAFVLSTCGAVGILIAVAEQLSPVVAWLRTLAAYGDGQGIACLLQVMGIALAAQFAADACRDAGMSAAATAAELCGRVLALLQALPLVQSLVASFLSFLQ